MENDVPKTIHRAIANGDISRARALLEMHREHLSGHYGTENWILTAVGRKNVEMARLLLELGCDANAAGPCNDIPLEHAIEDDNVALVHLLLHHGAHVDTDTYRLVIGAIVGDHQHSLELVKLLEEYGADLHKIYTNEYTGEPMNALSTAIDWGKHDVAEYLRSKGAVLPTPTKPPAPPRNQTEEIVAYFQEHFGPVRKQSLIEIVQTPPAISIHLIPPDGQRNCVTLFTTGMSNRAMRVPEGGEDYRFAELFIQLPGDWPLTLEALGGPQYGWPIYWLRAIAKYPHQHKTWLGGPVTIFANDDPPEPLAPNVKFTCFLLLVEREMETRKRWLGRGGRNIVFYRLIPLYTDERDLEMKHGVAELMRALDRNSVPFVVDVNRKSVATARSM